MISDDCAYVLQCLADSDYAVSEEVLYEENCRKALLELESLGYVVSGYLCPPGKEYGQRGIMGYEITPTGRLALDEYNNTAIPKAAVQAEAEQEGESINSMANRAILADMGLEEWPASPEGDEEGPEQGGGRISAGARGETVPHSHTNRREFEGRGSQCYRIPRPLSCRPSGASNGPDRLLWTF